MLAATNFFRVDDLLVQIYNSEVEMAQDVAEIAQKHLQQVLNLQDIAGVLLATGNSQLKFLDIMAFNEIRANTLVSRKDTALPAIMQYSFYPCPLLA